MDLIYAQERRKFLVEELAALRQKAINFGITGNRKYYARGTIEQSVWDAYKKNSSEIERVERELRKVNEVLKDDNKSIKSEYESLKQLLKECLPNEDYIKIVTEREKRGKGEHPTKVSLTINNGAANLSSKINELRKILVDAIDTIICARKGINEYISANEPVINKADYLKKVSPLNRCIPSLKEIELLKTRMNRL